MYIAAECFPVSCLRSLSMSSSHASICLTFCSLEHCVSHTRTCSGKQCKQPCYCGTCVHNVLAASQFQEWHYTFLEMDPNWIKLCCNTDLRCWMTWTGSGGDQSEDGYTVLWLIPFCWISKHLDLLWGAGYPEIPKGRWKKAHFLSWASACFRFYASTGPKPTSKNVNIDVLFQKL